MKAPIDLHIPGDTGSIYALANWVSTLGTAVSGLTGALARLGRDVHYYWDGESAQSFQGAATRQLGASQPLPSFAAGGADVFEAYADRIVRGRNSFADYAEAAAAAGMKVVEKRYIRPPEPPGRDANGDCVPTESTAQADYEKAVRLFNEIERLVETWRTDTTMWIKSNFTPLVARIGDFDLLEKILNHLEMNGFTVAGALIDEASARVTDLLGDFTDRQRSYEEAYDKFKSDARSGNPARSAAAEGFDKAGNRTALESIEKNIDLLKPGKTVLRVGGPAVGAVEAAIELAQGESPSTVIAGGSGSLAGGAIGAKIGSVAGGAILAPVAPVGAAIGGVAGGALGAFIGGGAAKTAWEEWVPTRTRDAIDAGLHDKYRLRDAYDTRIKPPKVARG